MSGRSSPAQSFTQPRSVATESHVPRPLHSRRQSDASSGRDSREARQSDAAGLPRRLRLRRASQSCDNLSVCSRPRSVKASASCADLSLSARMLAAQRSHSSCDAGRHIQHRRVSASSGPVSGKNILSSGSSDLATLAASWLKEQFSSPDEDGDLLPPSKTTSQALLPSSIEIGGNGPTIRILSTAKEASLEKLGIGQVYMCSAIPPNTPIVVRYHGSSFRSRTHTAVAYIHLLCVIRVGPTRSIAHCNINMHLRAPRCLFVESFKNFIIFRNDNAYKYLKCRPIDRAAHRFRSDGLSVSHCQMRL